MRHLLAVLGCGALALAMMMGCGGASGNAPDAKGATGPKQIDDDPAALLPSAALMIVNVDARALYASGSAGGQLGKLSESFLPIGDETGFVASRDLERVVAGTYTMQGADVAAVLVGKFDEQKIAQAAQAHVQMKNGGVIVASQYGGRTLYTMSNVGFTVISARTVVAGTETGIRRAIDRLKDGRVTRDQPPWMLATIDTPGAAFAVAVDLTNQPIGAASIGMMPLSWLQGLKAARVIGNFHDPGLNIAGTLTYSDPARASAAAGELSKTAASLGVFAIFGVPQLKNLDIKVAQSDTQTTFAIDDGELRAFLQKAAQFMPQQ